MLSSGEEFAFELLRIRTSLTLSRLPTDTHTSVHSRRNNVMDTSFKRPWAYGSLRGPVRSLTSTLSLCQPLDRDPTLIEPTAVSTQQ